MGSLTEIARFYDPEEAFCAQAFLRSCGFETYLQNEHLLSMAPHLRVAVNGYGLYSLDKTAAIGARSELENLATLFITSEAMDELGTEHRSRKNWFWLPTYLFAHWPFLPRIRSAGDVILQGAVIAVMYVFISMIVIDRLIQ